MKIIDIAKEIQKYFKNTKIFKTKIRFQDEEIIKENDKALKELKFSKIYLSYG